MKIFKLTLQDNNFPSTYFDDDEIYFSSEEEALRMAACASDIGIAVSIDDIDLDKYVGKTMKDRPIINKHGELLYTMKVFEDTE